MKTLILAHLDKMPLIDYIRDHSEWNTQTNCCIWKGNFMDDRKRNVVFPEYRTMAKIGKKWTSVRANIAAYMVYLQTGLMPTYSQFIRSCDNNACINADHLVSSKRSCRKGHRFEKRDKWGACPICSVERKRLARKTEKGPSQTST